MFIEKDGKRYEQPYNDMGLLLSIRCWLIKKIAGDLTVIINVGIKTQERTEDDFCVQIYGVDGGYYANNQFDITDDIELLITSAD